MNKLRRAAPSLAVLCATVIAACDLPPQTVEPSSVEITQAALSDPLPNNLMRDLRIYISFESGTGYSNDPGKQDQFRRGAVLAMRIWQSLFPALDIVWVNQPSQANLIFSVGDFGNTKVPRCSSTQNPEGWGHSAAHPFGWVGCSFFPGAWSPSGNTIYYNAKGSAPFLYDPFTFFSRQTVWGSYQPATLPPVNYHDPGYTTGWINGRFTQKADSENIDATALVFHEFGHTMGQSHQPVGGNLLAFYGKPHPQGGTVSTPHKFVASDTAPYPDLPTEYYGGGTTGAPWVGDLRFGTIPLHYMATSFDYTPPPGLIDPSLDRFSFRVFNKDAYNHLVADIPAYKRTANYPNSRGLILLERPSGERTLTSSWTTAVSLAQHDVATQSNPFFVTNIFNANQIQRVAIGKTHTLAVQADGSLWSWGKNDKGQLGDGNTTDRFNPKQLSPGPTWISVAAGDRFSFALRSDNSLWAWGDRSVGQLGDGVASQTPQLSAKKIGGNDWVAVKAGELHVVALKANGTVWTWGYNEFGQLGKGDTTNQSSPVQEYHGANDWVSISAGPVHSQAMRADGTLWTWGWNQYGTLGNNDNVTPMPVPRMETHGFTTWKMADGGFDFGMGLNGDGSVWTWGRNFYGQLAAPGSISATNSPQQWLGGETWTAVAAGALHGTALNRNGTLWTWGSNNSGQLGTGAVTGTTNHPPAQVGSINDWLSIFAKQEITLALREDGTLYGWGNNSAGQLGTGATSSAANSPIASKWSYYLPTVELTSPASGMNGLNAPASVPIEATATGNIARVEFWNNGTKLGEDTTSPYKFTWQNVGVGSHSLTAKAFNKLGQSTTSAPVTFTISYLKALPIATAPTTVNFTTQGTKDWLHAGLTSATSLNRKNIPVASRYLSFQQSNGLPVLRDTVSTVAITWTDGTPTGSATGTKTGVKLTPNSTGFDISALGSPNEIWELRVYGKNVQSSGSLAVSLDGQSQFVPWSTSSSTPQYRVFTVEFRPGAADRNLFVQLQGSTATGNISFLGATLRKKP